MSREQFERETLYQATMAITRMMLAKEIITGEDFSIIDTILREKYQPLLGGLYT